MKEKKVIWVDADVHESYSNQAKAHEEKTGIKISLKDQMRVNAKKLGLLK